MWQSRGMWMPLSHAAEKIVWPSSAVIILPSTSSVLTLMPGTSAATQQVSGTVPGGTTMLANMRFVFSAEVAQRAQHGIGSGDAEPAKAGRAQQAGELFQHSEIGVGSFAAGDARQDVMHLHRSGAAWDALAAGFVPAEFHEKARDIHHAGRRIHDDQAARAHHGADALERIVVHREIEVSWPECSRRPGRRFAPL